MGMFTTITGGLHSLQIKCGWDECETYKVGQKVPQRIIPEYPGQGYLLDDVYDSYSSQGPDDFVVISNATVIVEPRRASLRLAEKVGLDVYTYLKQKHNIKEPDPKQWSEEAWEKKRQREKEAKEESDAFMKSIEHLPPEQRLAKAMGRAFSRRVDWASLGAKVLSVEPIKKKD
jgi:hypothetical protein